MSELRVMFSEIEATEDGNSCCAVLEEFDGVDDYDQIDAVCFMLTENDYDTPEPYDEAMRKLFERNGVEGTIPVHTPWNGWEDVTVSDLTKPKKVKTKAQFRAMRDRVGLSQQDVADELDVNIKTVKRWEKPDNDCLPPEDAWSLLEHALNIQRQQVDYAFAVVDDQIDQTGKPPEQVVLTYFRDQQMYDDHGRDLGRFGQANATARAVAFVLEDLGCNVVFAYPGEGAIGAEGSRY